MTKGESSDQAPWRSTWSLERELAPLVQDVGLIAELDLSLSGPVYQTARAAFQNRISLGLVDSLAEVCPAATTIFLVAEGIHCYKAGAFWPNLSVKGISTHQHNAVGEQFLLSLSRLGLNSFHDVVRRENALPFLTPILLHGGIPADSAAVVWARLIEEMRQGQEEAGLVMARWRRYPHLLLGVGKPAERFILYGGEFAADLIQRMIQLADDVAALGKAESRQRGATALAGEAGLPRYLVEKLLEGPREQLRLGTRPPRPRVVFDPYSGDGPRLLLPPSPNLSGTWHLFWKERQETHRTSSYDERQVPLDPAPVWEVTFIHNGIERTTTLSPMENLPVYVFDDSDELLRNQAGFRGDSVLVLASRSVSFYTGRDLNAGVPEVEELPKLAGGWSGWQPRRLDITGLREVVVAGRSHAGEAFEETIEVLGSTRRPRLRDDHLPGMTDVNGGLVFNRPPRLRVDTRNTSRSAWRVRVRTSRQSPPITIADLETDPVDPGVFDLSCLFESQRVVSGTVEVLGPLGSDLRTPVTVVPGLQINMPDGVIGPDDSVIVRLSADVPLGDRSSTQLDIRFPPSKYTSLISAGVEGVDLLVSVPRLVWAFRQREGRLPSFGSSARSISLDEFVNGDIETLLVRVGMPSPVRLELHAGDLIQSLQDRAAGPEGRWAFPLAPFKTSAAHAQAARLYLRVSCHGITATVAVVEAAHQVSEISIQSAVNPRGETFVQIRWRENKAFKNREIRLWSNHRPAEPPTTVPVPDKNRGYCDFSKQITPGPYLLEIGIRDSWTSPTRPVMPSHNAIFVTIGTDKDLLHHLTSLDSGDHKSALELELAGKGPIRTLDEGQVGNILPELQAALFGRHREVGSGGTSDRLYVRLSELALYETSHLAEMIANIEDTSPADLARLLVTLIQNIIDCAPSGIPEPVLERLWRMSPVAGGSFDTYRQGDQRCAGRWLSFTGWDPREHPKGAETNEDSQQRLFGGGPIPSPIHTYSPEQLRDLAAEMRPSHPRVLNWGGHFLATLDFLGRTYDDRSQIKRWQVQHHGLASNTRHFSALHAFCLKNLEGSSRMPGWCNFPHDLMSSAFHLLVFNGNSKRATRALWDAVDFAPELANRSLLIAIILQRILHSH